MTWKNRQTNTQTEMAESSGQKVLAVHFFEEGGGVVMKLLGKYKKVFTLPIAGFEFGKTEGLIIWGQVFV